MWLLLLACDRGGDAVPADSSVEPPVQVVDMATYLQRCEQLLGSWPTFDCTMGTEVPITVTDDQGTHTVTSSADLQDGWRCDKPSIATCWTGARVGTVTSETGAAWTFACRSYDDDPTGYEQLNLIATDPDTGTTCFFNTPHHDVSFDGQDLPRPGSPEDLTYFGDDTPFWYTLDRLGGASCLPCHDNDALIQNAWAAQVELPERDLFAAYGVVAQDVLIELSDDWRFQDQLIHPDAAPCTRCHRLSAGRGCKLAVNATGRWTGTPRNSAHYTDTYPANRWMPHFNQADLQAAYPTLQDWEDTFGDAADTIRDCCDDLESEACWAPVEPNPI